MRTHTQMKVFFVAVLIALATLTIVTAPAQVMGEGQSKSSAVVALPQEVREPGQAVHSGLPGAGSSEHVADSPPRKRAIRSRATTPGSSLSFLPAVSYYSGGYEAFSIAVADVNGDGKPDLLVANYCASNGTCDSNSRVGVLLGNGDGTFQPAVTYGSGGPRSVSLVVADVNGDGRPDLLVANQFGGVGVLLGNGNGTFHPAVTYASGKGICSSVAVADLNGDGRLDLVVTTWSTGSVGVLLGNGDGTFQPVVAYPASGPQAAVIADVNGDGKPDVLVADTSGAGVLLGNGDGTFQPEIMYSSGGLTPTSIVSADLNGDDKQDLVVMNFDSGNVGVLLGNGDGTFQPAVTYGGADGAGTPSVALADVNGDGKLDLLVVNFQIDTKGDGGIGVFLGNGDGTFQPEVVFGSGGYYAWGLAVADVNGDGKLDLVAANLQLTGGQPLKGFVGVLINSTVISTPTTTKLVSSPNPSLVGQAVTFTATVSSTAGAPPNGEIVTFNNGSAVLDTESLSGGSASFITSSLPVGTSTITASYPGDATFGASTSPALKQVVNPTGKSPTSTSLASDLNPSIYGQKLTWTATITSSGSITPTGKVQFTWSGHTIGSATLNSNGVATLTRSNLNADTYPLTAVYSGDAAHLGSTSAVLKQVVLQATSTATLTSSPNPSAQGQAVTFTAKITSPTVIPTGPITFTAGKTVLGTGQLSGGKATLTISSLAVGSTTVTATYYGNSNVAKSSASAVQTVR